MFSQGGFAKVLCALIVLPALFSHFLLQSETFVVSLEFFVCLLALCCVFIFEHTSHAGNGLGLLSVSGIFTFFSMALLFHFSDLLVSPVFLVLSVGGHSLMIHYRKSEPFLKRLHFKSSRANLDADF